MSRHVDGLIRPVSDVLFMPAPKANVAAPSTPKAVSTPSILRFAFPLCRETSLAAQAPITGASRSDGGARQEFASRAHAKSLRTRLALGFPAGESVGFPIVSFGHRNISYIHSEPEAAV
jgi:hypothetical protein